MRLRHGNLSLFALVACVVFVLQVRFSEPERLRAQISGQSVSPYIGADSVTLLFEDFEGDSSSWQTESLAVSARVDSGYLGGQALFLSDTGAWAQFADSWFSANSGGFQESGTFELFYRPETFVFTGAKSYGMLVTQREWPSAPAVSFQPQLAIFEDGITYWALTVPPGYRQVAENPDLIPNPYEKLNPGQWYHIAGTWGEGQIALYINNTLMDSATGDSTFVRKDTFTVGATGALPATFGWAARGRIDKFRLSARARSAGEFPQALTVEISSPVGVTVEKPFSVTYRAFLSDTRPIAVELYADTDQSGLNGTLLASGLPAEGTALVGNNLADTTFFIYAIAYAGTDTASYYTTAAIQVRTPGAVTATQRSGEVGCVLTRAGLAEPRALGFMRGLREEMLSSRLGRLLVKAYHACS